MKLVICSDIHDNIWVLAEALKQMPGDAALLFCGDFCAPFSLVQLAEGFAGPIHVVWGNNDGDKWLLTQQAARFSHVVLHGELAEIELTNKRITANHYPHIARHLAASGQSDIVCYGHDHIAFDEVMANGTLLLNPGELMGRFGRSTLVVVDLDSLERTWVEVERP